jgi:hypothetical protein
MEILAFNAFQRPYRSIRPPLRRFNLSRTELFTEDLSLNVFAMANLSDFSGFVRPGLSYQLFDGASLGLSPCLSSGLKTRSTLC